MHLYILAPVLKLFHELNFHSKDYRQRDGLLVVILSEYPILFCRFVNWEVGGIQLAQWLCV